MSRAPLSLLLLATPFTTLPAQGWVDSDRRPVDLRMPSPLVRIESRVRATVDGRVARFEILERFRNNGPMVVEGTYLYPLPGEAVFSDFTLFQGEQALTGEMLNAEQARTIYEGIVRRLKDPALLTLVGHGLIRAQIFPVQPGEVRTVVLRYTQLLNRDGDALRVRYAAGDRGEGSPTLTVDIKGETDFATPYSPTHTITTDRRGGDLRVTIGQPVRGDVELLLPYRRGLVGGSVLTHAEPGEDGFALLFLAPPLAEDTPALSRDLTLVVDVSGSMSGEKIDQAKAALRQALSTLRPRDRFRLISFSNGVRQFREHFTLASPDALDDARRFVDGLAANGGTNLAGAIETALSERPGAERLGIVLLLTDGIPTVGEQAPERIAAEAGAHIGSSRIFTIGVGTDVNTYLLDRLAVDGRGSASYVAPGVDVGDAMGTVLTRISRPALTDLRIVDAPVQFQEQAPSALPDLFYGEELVVLARYRGEGSGPVVIEGTRNGRRERFTIAANFGRNASGDFIPPLWAARRIGELTRQIRLEGASPALIERVRELGLRYGILTEYTSYLVQEPGSNGPQPPPMPTGAPMARMMTGGAAFDAAKASANMSASDTRQAAEAAVAMRLDEMRDRSGGKELRRAGGKVLIKREGVWTDVAFKDGMKVRSVAPFSAAYFALVKARPGLRAQLAAGHPLVLAGTRIALRIAEDGVTQWAAGELDRFLVEYEGR